MAGVCFFSLQDIWAWGQLGTQANGGQGWLRGHACLCSHTEPPAQMGLAYCSVGPLEIHNHF